MEKNSAKISLGTAICMFIILILIIALVAVYYFGFVRENEEANLNINAENTNITVENKVEDVESIINNEVKVDTVQSKSYGEPLPLEGVAKLKDGYLYYSYNNSEEPEKIEGVSNIKSLEIYNIGTGINRVPFVVTEEGVVYRLNSAKQLAVYEELSNYKVDKIISHEGEMYDVFTLLLLDGTTRKVIVSENNESTEDNKNNSFEMYQENYKNGFKQFMEEDNTIVILPDDFEMPGVYRIYLDSNNDAYFEFRDNSQLYAKYGKTYKVESNVANIYLCPIGTGGYAEAIFLKLDGTASSVSGYELEQNFKVQCDKIEGVQNAVNVISYVYVEYADDGQLGASGPATVFIDINGNIINY